MGTSDNAAKIPTASVAQLQLGTPAAAEPAGKPAAAEPTAKQVVKSPARDWRQELHKLKDEDSLRTVLQQHERGLFYEIDKGGSNFKLVSPGGHAYTVVIFGPNGCGKTTLLSSLKGAYEKKVIVTPLGSIGWSHTVGTIGFNGPYVLYNIASSEGRFGKVDFEFWETDGWEHYEDKNKAKMEDRVFNVLAGQVKVGQSINCLNTERPPERYKIEAPVDFNYAADLALVLAAPDSKQKHSQILSMSRLCSKLKQERVKFVFGITKCSPEQWKNIELEINAYKTGADPSTRQDYVLQERPSFFIDSYHNLTEQDVPTDPDKNLQLLRIMAMMVRAIESDHPVVPDTSRILSAPPPAVETVPPRKPDHSSRLYWGLAIFVILFVLWLQFFGKK